MKIKLNNKLTATLSYISCIVLLNCLFVKLPGVSAFGQAFSPADAVVGIIYIVRDFAQREIKHYIFLAMLIGSVISYLLADPVIALASVSAFISGEVCDWGIFTFTKKPLSKRLILSSIISSPIDSVIFLYVANRLHVLSFCIMTLGKITGVMLLWLLWRQRHNLSQKNY
jgi:queuosine precursor transporter